MSKTNYDFDEDRHWTEAEWEAFMKDADNRAARFGELLETLRDDPDRHAKIAKEMGWNKRVGERDPEVQEIHEAMEERAREIAGNPDANMDEVEQMDREIEAIPAYQICMQVGEEIHNALNRYMKEFVDNEDIGRLLGAAAIGAWIGSAKISGGHATGTEDDQIGGNIANCNRGLKGMQEGREALVELGTLKIIPAKLASRCIKRMDEAMEAVREHIESLRRRVWWDM